MGSDGYKVDWFPERQTVSCRGEIYEHEGETNTDPSHDLVHALLGATADALPWRPAGTADDVRLAEYYVALLQHLLDGIFTRARIGAVDDANLKNAVEDTIGHGRWLVAKYYAPFPLPSEEAQQRFFTGVDWPALVRLSPLFFAQKRIELTDPGYRERSWRFEFLPGDHPQSDGSDSVFRAALSRITATFPP